MAKQTFHPDGTTARWLTPLGFRCVSLCRGLVVVLLLLFRTGYSQESPHGKIRFECTTCHSTETWKVARSKFKHEVTGFALNGRHQALTCESCHKALKFSKQASSCVSCHTDVHKSELGANCLRCHTTATWKIADMVQRHQTTRFPLLGKHATLACQSCHANAAQKQYSGTPTDCFGCHRDDFTQALRPNHAASGFSMNCAQCHNVTAQRWGGWFVHEKKILAAPTECVSCHRTDFVATRAPNHAAVGFSTECKSCHLSTVQWMGARFDHSQTRFPLVGAHSGQQCQRCHSDNVFTGRPSDCMSCHRPDYNRAINPNHVAGNFPADCSQCHVQTAFRPATFNHANTRFPLTGAHAATACVQCHVNSQYTNTPTSCVGCHQTNFNNVTNPNHRALNFSTNCQQCHSTTNWRSSSFDHNTTQFALTGRHATIQCAQCHVNNNYQLVFNNNCQQCHQAQFNQPTNPRHVAPSFGANCAPCHSTSAWRPSSFSHNNTRFPLTGRHVGENCNACHVNDVYRNLPGTCWDCHSDDFNRATNPNHVQGNYNHDCTQCHNTNGWDNNVQFNHSTTAFPLTGAHVPLQCVQCHVNGNYQIRYNNDCKQCHEADYIQPTNPRHVLPSFGVNCSPCHNTTVWRPSTFNHSSTNFPLAGAHQTVACSQCHQNNQYQLPHTCWDCHSTDFINTTNPNHQQGQFSHDCTQCHTQAAWNPASFNHNNTLFPLTGAHVPLQCVQCHVNGNYQIRFNNDCKQCHEADYNQPTNPRHVLPSFGVNCSPCHNTTVWRPSTFSHANTAFPLVGAHQAVACNQCHQNNQYQLPHTCWDCHSTDFNNTTNPNHQQGQFSHDCLQCHSQNAWSPATFNHNSTNFPLTGAHVTTACVSCHVNGNYQLQYTDCYQCHQDDFARPTNPNHVTLVFSHNCERCHSTSAWRPSTYNHDVQYFRIYSGAHRNRWNNNCASCHPTLGQYQLFTCTTSCHPRAEMDNEHRNRQGYRYESPLCYQCHRND